MKKIKILGETVEIKFNMAVEIGYEQIAGKPFNMKEIEYMSMIVPLSLAAIVANNPETKITFDRLMTEAKPGEIDKLCTTTLNEMFAWMKIPEAIQKEEAKEAQPDVNEEQPKN